MKIGIYFAYWENEWIGNYHKYIDLVSELGFDILEISCASLPDKKDDLISLRSHAKDKRITLTAGYGPTAACDLSSPDPSIARNAKAHLTILLEKLELLDINIIGGGLYSYWPVDYSQPVEKEKRWDIAVKNIREMAHVAGEHGVTLCMETLNRYESYLINTAQECRKFVEEVDHPNAGIMLDTFHMNIEETSFYDAIICAGDLLKHVHLGEANRRVPGKGRLPWGEIGSALRAINYNGGCVMEPFVMQGGTIGKEIRIWRTLETNTSADALNKDAQNALQFIRYVFNEQ